jgi:hypothetical protein
MRFRERLQFVKLIKAGMSFLDGLRTLIVKLILIIFHFIIYF